MSVRVRRSEWCLGDLEHYAAWYDREAGWELAQRYLRAVATSTEHLAENPEIGRRTHSDNARFPERQGHSPREDRAKRCFDQRVQLRKCS